MPQRNVRREQFSLDVSTLAAPVGREGLAHRHLWVADMPAAAAGLVLLGLDGGPAEIPLTPGLRLTACDGRDFETVTVATPAVGGTLTLIFTGDDAVPFVGSGAPGAAALWQLDVVWPSISRTVAEGGPFDTGADAFGGPHNADYAFWDAAVLGAGASSLMSRMHNNELICGYVSRGGLGAATRAMDGASMNPALTRQAWPAAFRMPDHSRLWWLQFLMAWNAGAVPGPESGIQFIVSAGVVGGWNVAALNTGAFGLVGDGAGGMQFFAKRGAGSYVATPLVWPNALSEVVLVDVLIRAAGGNGAARLDVLLNGVGAIARDWEAGTTLPEYAHGTVANSNKFVPVIQANDAAVTTLAVGRTRFRVGRLDYAGVPVL